MTGTPPSAGPRAAEAVTEVSAVWQGSGPRSKMLMHIAAYGGCPEVSANQHWVSTAHDSLCMQDWCTVIPYACMRDSNTAANVTPWLQVVQQPTATQQ